MRSLGARIGGFGNRHRAGSDKSSAWESLLGEALSAFCQKFTGLTNGPPLGSKLDHSHLSRADVNRKHKTTFRAGLKTPSAEGSPAARGNLELQLTNGLSGFYTGNFP